MSTSDEPIYGQEGSCEVGRKLWLFRSIWTQGLCGLYIYRDELVLKAAFRRYCFPRDKILLIHRYRYPLQIALKIKHAVPDCPPFVVFGPTAIEEMEEALDANAFPVETPTV